MQLDKLIAHIFLLVGSLWITKQGIGGIAHHKLQVTLRSLKRVYVSVPALVLGLAYLTVGVVTAIMIVVSFFQTDYRLLQLVGVIWVALIMINLVAYWFAQDPVQQ